jgi:ubiquinone/menaquinone biosynthesis C-methylase UbiE
MTWNDLYKNDAILKQQSEHGPSPCVMNWAEQTFNLSSRPSILDVGCGTGRNAFWLAQQGAHTHACDNSEVIVNHIKNGSEASLLASLRICEADDLSSYEDSSFDGVLCDGVIQYLTIEKIRKSMTEMFRVLRLGGAFFCTAACVDDKRNIGPGSLDFKMPAKFFTGAQFCGIAEEAGFMVIFLERSRLVLQPRTQRQVWHLYCAKPI